MMTREFKPLVREYKPREIARLGLIKNGKGSDNESSNYQYIIKLINSGKLKVTRSYGTSKRPYFLISEAEIKRFNRGK